MMILKKLCYGLSGSLFLASSLFTIPSHAATDSIGLTVTTDVEMGTCTSTLTDDGTTKISTINFGDVYISEINAETKIKTFKLQFKDCAGIPGKKAKIKLTTRALCEGNSNNGPGFAKEGANKRGNSSRLTQSFHFFMFEPIFSPVNALNQPI